MGVGEYSPQERQQLQSGQPIERQVDRGRGAGFLDRMMAGFKSTPKERVDFWKARRGEQNVAVSPNEEILLQDPNAPGQWHPVDPAGADMGDVADLIGDLPEATLTAVMGAGGVLRAGFGALLGNLAKQGAGAALPGEVEARPGERAGEAAGSAALGGVAQGVVNLLRAPGAIKKRMTDRLTEGIQTDVRAEGLRLEGAIGEGAMLRPSQVTGSANLAKAEGFLERNPFASSTMARMDLEQRMIPIQKRTEAILQKMSGSGGAAAEDLGTALREGLEKAVDVGWDNLNRQATKDFAVLEGVAGKIPTIPLTNYLNGLSEIVELYGQKGYGSPAASVAAQAKKMMDEIVQTYPDGNVSAAELQRRLAHLGRAAYGKAPSVFKDVDIPFAKEVQRDLHKLLRADLAVAAESGRGAAAKLLRQARENYETNLKAVHGVQNNLLAKYLSRAPDQIDPSTVADFFLKAKPGTLRGTLELVENVAPGTANLARAHVLERALQTGRQSAQQSGDFVPGSFDLNAFLRELPSGDKLTALFGGKGQSAQQVLKEVKDVVDFTERAVMTKQSGTIQRPQHQQVLALMRNFSVGAFVHTFGSLGMARVIASPQGRKAFIGMAEAKSPTAARRAMQAVDKVMPGIIYELMKSMDTGASPNVGEE
jgi:hypothetical protein